MKIAVCDDNMLFLQDIKAELQALPMVDSVALFSDLTKFLFSIEEGQSYDAVLMDIEWDEKISGMDAASELFKLCPEIKIIYVTGHVEQFSQQIFLSRANLSGYLTKPVDTALLQENIQKVAETLHAQDQPVLMLKTKGALISIPMREIYFIQSQGHIACVHTADETIKAYEKLGKILQSLPADFYQCHKSFIVNMSKIRRFLSDEVLLKNGASVPVSRAKYTATKDAYFTYMGQRVSEGRGVGK